MKKILELLLVAVMMLSVISGCTTPATDANTNSVSPAADTSGETGDVEAGTEQSESAEPKVLTYIKSKEPISLDTSLTNDEMSSEVLYMLSEGLLRSYNGKTVPGIAETWEVSEDGLTYTFHLRESVWEDGEPVTAQQFEYSFQRFLSPDSAAAFANVLYPVVNAEKFNLGELADFSEVGVKALDDYTFEITLEYPVPYFLNTVATNAYFYPLRQDFVEEYGDSYAADETAFLSNGPFTLKKWDHEASITLAKNPNFWNADAIKLDEIVQLIVADANTAASMYDADEVDFIPELAPEFTATYPEAQISVGGSIQFLEFNTEGMTPESGKVLSNINFRKALSYAIDRSSLVIAVGGAGTLPASRLTNPDIMGVNKTFVEEYPTTVDVVPENGDIALAQEYLATALDELDMTVDELPTITYVAMESVKHKMYAEAFLDTWTTNLGITSIEISILPVPQALQAGMDHEFDIFLLGLGTETDPYSILAYWTDTDSTNWSGWADDSYTALLEESKITLDTEKRFGILAEAENYLLENGPIEPLFFPGTIYVVKDNVTDVVKSSIGVSSQLIYTDKE